MARRERSRGRGVGIDDHRGVSRPSLPLAIALVLLVLIAGTGAAFSLGLIDVAFGGPSEVTTDFNESVIEEGEAVAVTVLEESSGEPVDGATVVPTGDSVSLASAPEVTADADGRAVFAVGDGEEAIAVNWGVTAEDGTVGFEVRPPGGDLVDDEANPTVTVVRD